MRRPRGVVAGAAVACALGSGCFLFPRPDAGPVFRHYAPADEVAERRVQLHTRLIEQPAGRRVQLHTRLIEQPAGNDYLTRGLWADAPDPLPHELSGLLAANGFRVGVVSGVIPGEFERLGTSEAAVVEAAVRTVQPGRSKAVPAGKPVESCLAGVVANLSAEPRPIELSSAECVLMIAAEPLADGRVRVRCEPQIRHGESGGVWRVNPDGTGFDHQFERPTEAFPALAFDLTLARGEVLVFGPTAECDDRLGQAFFFSADPSRVRQRVLTVQAGATGQGDEVRPSGAPAGLVR